MTSHGEPWRGLRDSSVLALLALIFGLQLFGWSQLEGYQLADSVEYMERAQALVRGEEVIDSQAIRSFGFVSVLAPIFWLADLFGVEDFKFVVGLVRLVQMFIGLGLVYASARLAARLAGRRAGLVAGIAIGVNPYFLLYSASPVSGMAAGLCVALALDSCLRFEGWRRGVVGGLWLGGALLMAYKTVLISLPLIGLLVLVGRRAHWRSWLGVCTGFAIGIVGAIGLDKLCYGEWGKSLDLYTRMNFGQLGTRFAARFGFMDLAKWFWEYTGGERNQYYETPDAAPAELLHEPNPLYHLTHLPDMVVWPLLLLFAVGVLYALRRGDRALRVLTVTFFLCAAAISLKKSTDFRLMLPLLACIGVSCGIGWGVLVGERGPLVRNARAWLGVLLVLAGAWMGQLRLGELGSARFAGYWRAMAVVDSMAERRGAGEQDYVVACAWHWSVYLRESAGVELRKLPHQLDRWPRYDEAQRARDLEALGELDAFITHLAVLTEHPELFRAVNELFEVETVLYDREVFENLGPIVVFERRSGEANARSFLTRTSGEVPLAYIEQRELQSGRRFLPATPAEGDVPLTLLGWKYETLPGRQHGWLSLHWYCDVDERDTRFDLRLGIQTEVQAVPWQRQQQLGGALAPSGEWRAGEIISEGWPVVAAAAPFDWTQEWQPLYGDEPPGARVPAVLWMRVTPEGAPPLAPVTNDGGVLVTPEHLDAEQRGPDGLRVSPQGFVELGAFELLSPRR